LRSLVPLLRGRSDSTAPASETVLATARDILPELQDPDIRRIAVSLMSSMAELHKRLEGARAEQADGWLMTGLELAQAAQQARPQRLAGDPGAGSAGVRETRCLVRLLQPRARLDLRLVGVDLDSAPKAAGDDEMGRLEDKLAHAPEP
jgi:hypothetical protein